jgi:hypothetical protein
MSGQLSGGLSAYQLPADRKPGPDDLVNIFDPAPCDTVGSVEAQRTAIHAYWQRPPTNSKPH